MRAVAIHAGLNAVDPSHYNGWSGTLAACENDARDMATITARQGFETTLLLTRQATSVRLLQLLAQYATQLVAGDTLVLSFAGHGAQVPDRTSDEPDRLDETWVLYDRMLIDDELYNALSRLRPGVRAIVVADSCHSGTSLRAFSGAATSRLLPASIAQAVYRAHGWTYGRARAATPPTSPADLRCDALLLAACQDSQLALDGENNGLFTGTLKRVWAAGRFTGDYFTFIRRLREQMPRYQVPNLLSLGPRAGQLELERPFSARARVAPTTPPSSSRGGVSFLQFQWRNT